MNKGEKESNNNYDNNQQKETEKNKKNENKTKNDLIEANYDNDEYKKIIEERVDSYLMKEYDELFNNFEIKLNHLLNIQEELFIENDIIKQKLFHLDNYLKIYCQKNNIDINLLGTK